MDKFTPVSCLWSAVLQLLGANLSTPGCLLSLPPITVSWCLQQVVCVHVLSPIYPIPFLFSQLHCTLHIYPAQIFKYEVIFSCLVRKALSNLTYLFENKHLFKIT